MLAVAEIYVGVKVDLHLSQTWVLGVSVLVDRHRWGVSCPSSVGFPGSTFCSV